MIYDEQPTTAKQSWDQRMRWSKGFYQVDAKVQPAADQNAGAVWTAGPDLL